MMGNKFFNLLTLIVGNNFLPSLIMYLVMIIFSSLFYNKDEIIQLTYFYTYVFVIIISYIFGYYCGKIKTEFKTTSDNDLSKISYSANEIYNEIYTKNNPKLNDKCMRKLIKSINSVHKKINNNELKFYQLFVIEDYLVSIRHILKKDISNNELDKDECLKIFYLYLKVAYLESIILNNIDLVYSIVRIIFKNKYMVVDPIRFKNYIGIAEDFDSTFDREKCDLEFKDIMIVIEDKNNNKVE